MSVWCRCALQVSRSVLFAALLKLLELGIIRTVSTSDSVFCAATDSTPLQYQVLWTSWSV